MPLLTKKMLCVAAKHAATAAKRTLLVKQAQKKGFCRSSHEPPERRGCRAREARADHGRRRPASLRGCHPQAAKARRCGGGRSEHVICYDELQGLLLIRRNPCLCLWALSSSLRRIVSDKRRGGARHEQLLWDVAIDRLPRLPDCKARCMAHVTIT